MKIVYKGKEFGVVKTSKDSWKVVKVIEEYPTEDEALDAMLFELRKDDLAREHNVTFLHEKRK